MKQFLYKSLILFFITSISVCAQEKVLYNDSFDAKEISVIDLDLRNIPILILPSLDNKISIRLSVNHKNFSKKEFEKIFPKVIVKTHQNKNILDLKIHSDKTISSSYYVSNIELKIDDSKLLKSNKKVDKFKRKTKQDIINEIAEDTLKEESILNIIFKKAEEDEKAKKYRPKFVVRIPENIIFNIDAYKSSIKLEHTNPNKLTLKMNKGGFTARKLLNPKISIINAPFRVEQINNGSISLKNGSGSLIGSIYRTTLKTESSFLKVGLVEEKVKITDFNSEIFLYNFSPKFNEFNFNGEYSKIHFYETKSNYSLKVIGNNTVSKFDNFSVTMQPTKSAKKFKMMQRKRNQKVKNYAGHIDLDIVHGIIYSHNETFIKSKTP